MKILIAPDKFKGSLSALEVARALRDGFALVWPESEFDLHPVADGGDGTAEVLLEALQGQWLETQTQNALGQPITARYGLAESKAGRVALLEMSEASGLRRLSGAARDPLHATTRGTGELLLQAARQGVKRIIIGIGGSATNDGGAGMAAALGYRFIDETGRAFEPSPIHLRSLVRIESPERLQLPEVLAAVDVRNPLLGPQGATRTYGPQKGAGPQELEILEGALERLADVAARDLNVDYRNAPGAGAAGGLGFGLLAFCKARVQPGFSLVAEALDLEQAIANADLVVTGEGGLDAQTLHGKAPSGVADLARKHGKPVIAFAGSIADEDQLRQTFDAICPLLAKPMALQDAMSNAASLLRQSAARAGRLMQLGKLLH